LLVSVSDPVGSRLFLLALKGLNRWIWIHFFFRLKTGCFDWFVRRFSGRKKAALEIVSRKREIFFFSLNSIKWAGRWGAAI
jgi:hypothetical protein